MCYDDNFRTIYTSVEESKNWIGASREAGGADWKWYGTEDFTWPAFVPDITEDTASPKCLLYEQDSSAWTEGDCTNSKRYLCERDIGIKIFIYLVLPT